MPHMIYKAMKELIVLLSSLPIRPCKSCRMFLAPLTLILMVSSSTGTKESEVIPVDKYGVLQNEGLIMKC